MCRGTREGRENRPRTRRCNRRSSPPRIHCSITEWEGAAEPMGLGLFVIARLTCGCAIAKRPVTSAGSQKTCLHSSLVRLIAIRWRPDVVVPLQQALSPRCFQREGTGVFAWPARVKALLTDIPPGTLSEIPQDRPGGLLALVRAPLLATPLPRLPCTEQPPRDGSAKATRLASAPPPPAAVGVSVSCHVRHGKACVQKVSV